MHASRKLLALHGFTGCGEDFRMFAPLCGADLFWHCPDLPGHGAAPELDCTPEAVRRFVERARASLDEGGPRDERLPILVGYSMGARAALLHATQHPERWRALVLISGSPGIEPESERAARREADDALAERIKRDGVPAFLERWYAHPLIRSQASIDSVWRESMHRHRLRHSAEGLSTSLRQFGQGRYPNQWPTLQKITCPVLLITGDQDGRYKDTARRMRIHLPEATHHSVAGAGHMPHLEAPGPTAAVFRSFIDGLC